MAVTALFGNLDLTVKSIGHSSFVMGIILWSIGLRTLPELKELEWRGTLRHLFLIMKSGVCIFDHSFNADKTADTNLVAGGITGITHLIPEMTRSEEKVEVIQQKGTKILLKYGRYVNVVLITQKDLQILHTKLVLDDLSP